jgi:hypothetical protein
MAKSGYDQTYEDDRKENEETRALVNKAVSFVTPTAVKTAAKYIAKSEFDTDKRMPDTGKTTNPMGDKYAKGGMVSSASKRADGCATKGKTRGKIC